MEIDFKTLVNAIDNMYNTGIVEFETYRCVLNVFGENGKQQDLLWNDVYQVGKRGWTENTTAKKIFALIKREIKKYPSIKIVITEYEMDGMDIVAKKKYEATIESPQSVKGFKTATYGKKTHRDDITQLENSVRRMF